ncbi:DNA primase family protein [Enterococcus cecorum]|uniref:DNA primase family protein n=1 Tax=Enterococcus cecorum TaxID=44008 RepID=UPI002ACA387B|nr:phage/plasmid primase, P4 family [Enterococcus cecorum]MDZ5560345.1 phage/plasmid primase, P4 family [Enterococcus cecorum]
MSLEDIQKLQQEQENALRPPESTNKLLWGKELKNALYQAKQAEIARINAELDIEGSKKQVNALNISQTIKILRQYIEFCIFDDMEGARLAMYQPNKGIYTQNTTIIERVLNYIDYGAKSARFTEIIKALAREVPIRPKTIDKDLITVKNGVVDLKRMKLLPFSHKYVFDTTIDTAYNPNIKEPCIDGWTPSKWLNDLACGNEQIKLLLLQVIADAVNGNYSRRKAILLYGNGSNGKGTFQALIENIVGLQNCANLKINQFGERFALSQLIGKTVVIGDDLGAGIYIDDSGAFNSVITNDAVLIEFKGQQMFSARLYCTVIQSTNEMPKMRNRSDGTYRRLIIVPFNAKFQGDGDNWKIKDEYINRDDVKEWFLQEALKLKFDKFIEPDISKDLLEQYKQENDPVADFKANVFDELVASGMSRIPTGMLYEIFCNYCEQQNYKKWSQKSFNKQLKELIGSDWEQRRMKYLPEFIGKIQVIEDIGLETHGIAPKVNSVQTTWIYTK